MLAADSWAASFLAYYISGQEYSAACGGPAALSWRPVAFRWRCPATHARWIRR